ncbi:MAG: hypothetical protein LBS36_11675 [Oscillospiraceae bacterium]|jgi:hypothetical protein|nr:hypothetical protein [Oscillospiraceae bacterium]
MSKRTKKLLSLFLAVLLGLSAVTVASAAPADNGETADVPFQVQKALTQEDEIYPTIILPGISQSVSYLADENGDPVLNADGDELSGGLMIIDPAGVVGKILKKLLLPLFVTLITQRDSLGFTDKVYELGCDLFSIQKSNPDGTPAENLVTRTFDCSVGEMTEEDNYQFYRDIPMQDLAERIGEENIYLFAFPLLGNPVENGKNLQDYIDFVKSERNAEKVNIVSVSLGGTVLTSWADYEGADYSSVNKIINVVSLLDGTDVMSDLMARNFNLDDQFVFSEFFPNIMDSIGNKALGYLVNIMVRVLPRSVFEKTLTRMTDSVLETFLLNAPQFWAMVPKDRYEGLADRYLNTPEKALLKEKTDRFHQAQLNLHDNLLAIKGSGVGIYNICGYNLDFGYGDYSYFGIVGSTKTTNSDAMIPIQSTSLGATAVPANTQFSDEYLAAADPKYISPDKSVDASTCLFKDNTWFYLNQHHEVGRTDLVLELASEIVTGHIDSIETDTVRFPQFIEGRKTNGLTGAIKEAKAILAAPEDYVAGKLPALQAALDEAQTFLDTTYSGGQESVEPLTLNLRIAIAEAKGEVYTAPSADPKLSFLEWFLKAISDAVFKYVGPVGYSDKTGYAQKQEIKGGGILG